MINWLIIIILTLLVLLIAILTVIYTIYRAITRPSNFLSDKLFDKTGIRVNF